MSRVLVTNDDGIDAPGLRALAAAAEAAGHEVVVAAPAVQSSGSSASIMADEDGSRIAIDRRELAGVDGSAFAVHGGPGLIALIASHGAFGERPDIVLSGVNHGANVGRAILHSGTVGAALTGGLNAAWAAAVSLDVGLDPVEYHWSTAADAAIQLLPMLVKHERGTVININVPNASSNRGAVQAELAPFGIVQTTLTERDEHQVRLAVEDLPNTPIPGSDAALLAEGWVTVTRVESVSQLPLEDVDDSLLQ